MFIYIGYWRCRWNGIGPSVYTGFAENMNLCICLDIYEYMNVCLDIYEYINVCLDRYMKKISGIGSHAMQGGVELGLLCIQA